MTQAPLVTKAQMDSKDLLGRKAQEVTRVPEEIQVPLAPLGPEDTRAQELTAEIQVILAERAPMALPVVAATRALAETQAQPVSLVPPEKRDHAVQPAPLVTWVQQVLPGSLVKWATRDNVVKPAIPARMVFPASQAERVPKVHAATQVIRATPVQPAEPDKRDDKV